MINFIIQLINIIIQLISLIIIIKVVLSYFLPPNKPIRYLLDRIIDPILLPIKRLLPPLGGIDISPIVLIVIVQIFGRIITSLLNWIF